MAKAGIVLVVVGIFLMAFAVLSFSGAINFGNLFEQKNRILCQVTLIRTTNPLFPGVDIVAIAGNNCKIERQCILGLQTYPMLFERTGTVVLRSGGSSDVKQYSLGGILFDTITKELAVCSPDANYDITLYDSNGNVLQQVLGVAS